MDNRQCHHGIHIGRLEQVKSKPMAESAKPVTATAFLPKRFAK
jgi:hypothetical protein